MGFRRFFENFYYGMCKCMIYSALVCAKRVDLIMLNVKI